MISRTAIKIILLMMGLMFCILIFYNASGHNLNLNYGEEKSIELNADEEEYIASHDQVKVYIDPALRYLAIDKECDGTRGNYMEEYLTGILSNSGMKPILVHERKNADCELLIVTDGVKKDRSDLNFSQPLAQVEGSLFVRSDGNSDADGKGVIVGGRISSIDQAKLTYNSFNMEFIDERSNMNAVSRAEEKGSDIDFIVGDREAVKYYMKNKGEFTPLEKAIYSLNVCIAIDDSNESLYNIINQCIYAVDRHELSTMASERWMEGNAPVYKKNSYSGAYMVMLIIGMAVIAAFLIYYFANRNLYTELQDRMDKLTASRKEMQTTFNGVSYFLAELTLEGDIIDVNRALYEYLDENAIGRKIWDVLHINNTQMAEDVYDQFTGLLKGAANGHTGNGMEIRFRRDIFFVELFPVEGSRGGIEKLLFMASNITNEVMAEKQMVQDNKMIAVGQLASGVAHEIRNPLGIIRNYCYVLKNMKSEDVQATAIQQIEKAVDTSGAIIENLLNFSRVSSKKIEEIDIGEHINDLLSLNEGLFKKKSIGAQLLCDKDFSVRIVVESLDMILINLISNAVDAMDKNGRLEIKVLRKFEYFMVQVTDDGEGIDAETLDDIFNPFFTTKIDSGGTGLGLYIVYNEIEKLNGRIRVESTPGKGTTFRVILPVNAVEPE